MMTLSVVLDLLAMLQAQVEHPYCCKMISVPMRACPDQ